MQGPWSTWKSPRDAAEHFRSNFAGCNSSWKRHSWGGQGFSATGNQAFDEYRKTKLDELEALRRKLDEERAEFDTFLNKMRKAKDAEEFDRFMAEKNAPKDSGRTTEGSGLRRNQPFDERFHLLLVHIGKGEA